MIRKLKVKDIFNNDDDDEDDGYEDVEDDDDDDLEDVFHEVRCNHCREIPVQLGEEKKLPFLEMIVIRKYDV